MSLSSTVDLLLADPPGLLHIVRSGAGTLASLALALLDRGCSVVIVARNQAEMGTLRSLLTLLSPDRSVRDPLPGRACWEQRFVSIPPYTPGSGGKSGWPDRMAALYALQERGAAKGVLATLDNFLFRLPPVTFFDTHELELAKGMAMDPELVLEQAIEWGYTRTRMVSTPGDIAVRGDILDIFCPGYAKPLRLEFFGDTIDDIRIFDAVSQRSVADIATMRLLPVSPVPMTKALRVAAESFWEKETAAGRLSHALGLARMADAGGQEILPGMFYEKPSCLEDWLPPESVYLLPGAGDILPVFETTERVWTDFLAAGGNTGNVHQPRARVLRPVDEGERVFASKRRVYFEELSSAPKEPNIVSLTEKRFLLFQDIFPKPEMLERPWHHLVALMRLWSKKVPGGSGVEKGGRKKQSERQNILPPAGQAGLDILFPGEKGRLVLSFSSERSRSRFLKLVAQDGIFPQERFDPDIGGMFALVSPFRQGAYLAWDQTLILGEDVLQPRVERARKSPRGVFQGLDRYDTLREGDFLVHREYGVGIFDGLHRMNLGGTENDYLLLQYAGDDRLYLPVDRLSCIQRFKGTEEALSTPDRLGGGQWAISKEKARKAIEKIAADLVEMYALRKVVKGFRYSPVGEMYREFEASFGFEETLDQARAIEDVLADMEKPEPMDRLVCGDVGFGKTEVALRAAFRAALDGRQAVLLCPTTVLAEQHYQTFRRRLSPFPVNIGMLSRFVPKARQKEVLEATARGDIDILIGTHRLLSKDVVIPRLGLLVLDEEQRFGVRHKERLKELRKNVDSLTLTATPIPRTLQLSLSGIRELSIIETPPLERKPVATSLISKDDAALKGIVERELNRQGQVFWVYNRVQGLERIAEYVQSLVPQARIGMAHGQVGEAVLEETMRKFWHGDLDVLVCTSIIESGLDFPRANTLVVDQAQLFGLGQLYQLRGRVGRSDRQAVAVFITPDPERLPEPARQRMRIILDMDYLGAGFQVAMEDLRLRGAGNILGETQTGHMNRLGLDLFLEMLEEAVAKVKGEPVQSHRETELSLGIPALIPEKYMPDSRERLRYYKMLSSAQDDEAQRAVELEILDRFGALPPELENFIAALSFKRYLSKRSVQKADIFPDRLRLTFAENATFDPAKLVDFVLKMQSREHGVRLHPPAVLELPLRGSNVKQTLQDAENRLALFWDSRDDHE